MDGRKEVVEGSYERKLWKEDMEGRKEIMERRTEVLKGRMLWREGTRHAFISAFLSSHSRSRGVFILTVSFLFFAPPQTTPREPINALSALGFLWFSVYVRSFSSIYVCLCTIYYMYVYCIYNNYIYVYIYIYIYIYMYTFCKHTDV